MHRSVCELHPDLSQDEQLDHVIGIMVLWRFLHSEYQRTGINVDDLRAVGTPGNSTGERALVGLCNVLDTPVAAVYDMNTSRERQVFCLSMSVCLEPRWYNLFILLLLLWCTETGRNPKSISQWPKWHRHNAILRDIDQHAPRQKRGHEMSSASMVPRTKERAQAPYRFSMKPQATGLVGLVSWETPATTSGAEGRTTEMERMSWECYTARSRSLHTTPCPDDIGFDVTGHGTPESINLPNTTGTWTPHLPHLQIQAARCTFELEVYNYHLGEPWDQRSPPTPPDPGPPGVAARGVPSSTSGGR